MRTKNWSDTVIAKKANKKNAKFEKFSRQEVLLFLLILNFSMNKGKQIMKKHNINLNKNKQ